MSTKAESFHSLSVKHYLQPKEREIMDALGIATAMMTRKELAAKTGMELSAVCGRVRSLLDKGVIQVRGTTIDQATNKRQEYLGIKIDDQGCFFDQKGLIDSKSIAG